MDERSPAAQRTAASTRSSHRAPGQGADTADTAESGGFFAVLEAVVLASPGINPEPNRATETLTGRVIAEVVRGGDR